MKHRVTLCNTVQPDETLCNTMKLQCILNVTILTDSPEFHARDGMLQPFFEKLK